MMDTDKFQRCIKIFDQICESSTELNGFFSWPVLLLMVTKFISVLSTGFAYFLHVVNQSSIASDLSIFLILYSAITDWIRIFIILHAADMPVKQVKIAWRKLLHIKIPISYNLKCILLTYFRFASFVNVCYVCYIINIFNCLQTKRWFLIAVFWERDVL